MHTRRKKILLVGTYHMHFMLLAGDWDFWMDWKDRQWWPVVTPIVGITYCAAIMYYLWVNYRQPFGATLCVVCLLIGEWLTRYWGFYWWSHYPINFVTPSIMIPGALIRAPEQVAACIERVGMGFMFAPIHHPAMKAVGPVRRELGVRTIFNILGPLTNPAGAKNQVMGVFHPDLVGIQVRVLQRLGSKHVMVVYGLDGLDEISISGPTMVGELVKGEINEYNIHPG